MWSFPFPPPELVSAQPSCFVLSDGYDTVGASRHSLHQLEDARGQIQSLRESLRTSLEKVASLTSQLEESTSQEQKLRAQLQTFQEVQHLKEIDLQHERQEVYCLACVYVALGGVWM